MMILIPSQNCSGKFPYLFYVLKQKCHPSSCTHFCAVLSLTCVCHRGNSRLRMDASELSRYAHFDPSKNYTRNLVSTDNEHFTLLLLCWNPGKESPVHDHPCDGCWMHVCEGNIKESRYERKGDQLECFFDDIYHGKEEVNYLNQTMCSDTILLIL